MQSDYIIVLTTVGSRKLAEDLARGMIGKRLAACVQIQRIESFYAWMDNIEYGSEHLLSIKTKAALFEDLSRFILQNHDYRIPEIVQIPIVKGADPYLEWIKAATK
ncbi:MAG: divalent-cation tolerance protein CutA [Puniceicoccales bacterium]|jgi:periplasmic divalent cation tolerance protein|nr:divalent-cation tolerance protein CutA [Puniceicoccales bacterium]